MISRRDWLKSAALVATGVVVAGRAFGEVASPATPITVYKTPTCACCKEWVGHLSKNGFRPTVHDLNDLSTVIASLGVPRSLESCHTAVVGKYVIEGHVPADLIRRLLAEHPGEIAGLSVPGMVAGSPGMETGTKEPFDVIAFTRDGKTSVFARR